MTVPSPETNPLPSAASFFRPTWADIDVAAFRHNLRTMAGCLAPGVKTIVVLKANGYGHGAVPLARAAAAESGVSLWGFGVSSIEEGLLLRESGFRHPVLILGSLFPFENFVPALEHDLIPAVASLAAARALGGIATERGRRADVHVKVDTGMGRIGVSPQAAAQIVDAVLENRSLHLEGIFTHLAHAESEEDTQRQLDVFQAVAEEARRKKGEPLLAHAANSAATFLYPRSHGDAVRPGLSLYGIYPNESLRARVSLQPVMTWKTRIVFLKTVKGGTAVSYGATFRTSRPSRLATLPVGYADGYRRILSNRAFVLVKGRRCPVLGRVTMDQIVVDVTDVPAVDVGEEVVLLGRQGKDAVTAEELAGWAETIPYEIVCGVSVRVPRRYVNVS
ncbi:MAG TPA: alanine racemase [Elusimicrobiota bacterium]|nr:alanine racemase [Elusimicrobiota bacterium]